jgi:hypothetical protein
MESSLNKLIEGFPANPVASGKFLQRLFVDDPGRFFLDSIPLLRLAPDTPGFYYVLALLHSHNLILKNLCNPALFTKQESVALAKRMSRVEPLFDLKLAKMLLADTDMPEAESAQEAQTVAGLRLLEIMAEASDRGRSLLLAQLLHHPNARVRSKAALLVGKSTKDAKWVSRRMDVADSRIRANALEALWGAESEDCRQVFLDALDDPANRVVGNGILGLYLLGAPSAIGSILAMIAHADEGFRKTGIWLMGEIGDLRFLPVLARLMKESTPTLRPDVFRAFAKLKQKRSRLAAMPALRLYALRGIGLNPSSREVHLMALSASGQPITSLKATHVALWENQDLILEYNMRPVMEKEPLSIAFAVPRNTGPIETPGINERALENCLQLKRKIDGWMILQYCESDEVEGSIAREESLAELRFLLDTGTLEKSINTRKPRHSSARSLLHAAGSLICAMSRARGRRHLIFLDDGSCGAPSGGALPEIVTRAKLAEISIHGISQSQTAWRDICAATGGQWLMGSGDQVPELLTVLYGYLTTRYQIKFQSSEAVDLRIQVFTDQGLGEVTLRD